MSRRRALNSIPVTVADVAFEGNFINIQVQNGEGRPLVVEARNDGAGKVPPPGSAHEPRLRPGACRSCWRTRRSRQPGASA